VITQVSGDGWSYAVFDESMEYRYRLVRLFAKPDTKRVIFIMLNPSTADAFKNDPTVTRCCGFAKKWGYTSLEVLNLFALRSTDPRALYKHDNPVSFFNDRIIRQSVADPIVSMVIAAWGNHGEFLDRGRKTARMVREIKPIFTMKINAASQQPGHPLYLKASTVPELWL
jgi:hypothetical protein